MLGLSSENVNIRIINRRSSVSFLISASENRYLHSSLHSTRQHIKGYFFKRKTKNYYSPSGTDLSKCIAL